MRVEDFTASAPGRLSPTVFSEPSGGGLLREVTGHAFVPAPLPPELEWKGALYSLRDVEIHAERALSRLDAIASQLDNPAMLFDPLMRREARLSSRIENTFASAEQMVLFDTDPANVEPDRRDEVRQVSNYVRALRHGFASELPICVRLICELHRVLLDGVERAEGRVGETRSTQNAVRGHSFESAVYVPPPPGEVDACLAAWERFVHNDQPPSRLVRFALAHYQFEAIHPFDDGNGRVGRLLIALQLCEQAQLSKPFVYISGFFDEHRQAYYDRLLAVSTRGEWLPWIEFFLTAVAEQATDAAHRAEALIRLRSEFHRRVTERRATSLLHAVVDELFISPAVTVQSVCRLTGIAPNSGGNLLRKLEELGIVREATGRNYRRVFVADAILAQINT